MVLVDICLSRWIRNFLLGRKQQVVLNGCSSAWSTLLMIPIFIGLLNAGKITYSFNVMLTDFWNGLMCTNSNLIYPRYIRIYTLNKYTVTSTCGAEDT